MSLKKYMWIDLAMLAVIGFAMELLGVYFLNMLLIAKIVTTVISTLIMFVAVFRWGYKGLILAPILASATIISGLWMNPRVDYRQYYDWRLYIACILQLLSFSVNILWFKWIKDETGTCKKLYSLFGLCAIDGIISILVLSFSYFLISRRFLLYEFLAWDAIGYAVLMIGAFILSRQGTLVNVKKKMEAEKEEKKNDLEEDFKLNLDDTENLDQKEGDLQDGENS